MAVIRPAMLAGPTQRQLSDLTTLSGRPASRPLAVALGSPFFLSPPDWPSAAAIRQPAASSTASGSTRRDRRNAKGVMVCVTSEGQARRTGSEWAGARGGPGDARGRRTALVVRGEAGGVNKKGEGVTNREAVASRSRGSRSAPPVNTGREWVCQP